MYDLIYIPLGTAAFGGAERSIAYLAGGMAGRGKRVFILSEKALMNTSYKEFVEHLGLQLEWVDWSPERNVLQNIVSIIKTFHRFRASIIHFNISWRRGMWLVPLLARMFTGARLIGSMRGMPDPHHLVPRRRYFGFIPGMRFWHIPEVIVGRIWAKTLHVTVSVNARDYPERLIKHYGFSAGRIRVIYNGVHIRSDELKGTEKNRLRNAIGLGVEDFLASYVGRLSREKGIDHLLQALSQLPKKYKLAIIGDGPQDGALKSLAKVLHVEDRVQFLGFIGLPDDFIGASDLVVVPSVSYEACPRIVLEAMNQGVPVVASRIGGMAELFTDGVEGIYVEPGSPSELSKVLEHLGIDPKKLRMMGRAARTLARDKYSFERMVEQYNCLYDELSGKLKGSNRATLEFDIAGRGVEEVTAGETKEAGTPSYSKDVR